MQWLSDLIKHFTISRSLTGALFITTAVLIFGHKFYPSVIEAIPPQGSLAVQIIFIFTLWLLVLWYIGPFCGTIVSTICHFVYDRLNRLTEHELELLFVLRQSADEYLNLRTLPRSPNLLKLELLDISKKLRKRGIVEKNLYNENLITLTEKGRSYALRLQPPP